jgi:hypothetical protein
MSDIITINVEGQIFQTKKETIFNIPYFSKLFMDEPEKTKEILFIDRSAKGFSHILQWIRNNEYKIPQKYRLELDFFGIEYKKSNFVDTHIEIKNDIKEIKTLIASLEKKLDAKIQKPSNKSLEFDDFLDFM